MSWKNLERLLCGSDLQLDSTAVHPDHGLNQVTFFDPTSSNIRDNSKTNGASYLKLPYVLSPCTFCIIIKYSVLLIYFVYLHITILVIPLDVILRQQCMFANSSKICFSWAKNVDRLAMTSAYEWLSPEFFSHRAVRVNLSCRLYKKNNQSGIIYPMALFQGCQQKGGRT